MTRRRPWFETISPSASRASPCRRLAVPLLFRLTVMSAALVLAVAPCLAQQSDHYKLTERVFNNAGNPFGGVILTSIHFKVTIDSVGDGLLGAALTSPTFKMDGGFVTAYPPPGEVQALRFRSDRDSLAWNPERSVGTYNLYRGSLSALPGGGYGACERYGLLIETTTDTDVPPAGQGYFYLVTAENMLQEEGIKGFDSHGVGRANPSPCP